MIPVEVGTLKLGIEGTEQERKPVAQYLSRLYSRHIPEEKEKNNIGVKTGATLNPMFFNPNDCLVVFDVDQNKCSFGEVDKLKMQLKGTGLETYSVNTPHGGFHPYFIIKNRLIATRVFKYGHIKAVGGPYVMGSGSKVKAGKYKDNGLPIRVIDNNKDLEKLQDIFECVFEEAVIKRDQPKKAKKLLNREGIGEFDSSSDKDRSIVLSYLYSSWTITPQELLEKFESSAYWGSSHVKKLKPQDRLAYITGEINRARRKMFLDMETKIRTIKSYKEKIAQSNMRSIDRSDCYKILDILLLNSKIVKNENKFSFISNVALRQIRTQTGLSVNHISKLFRKIQEYTGLKVNIIGSQSENGKNYTNTYELEISINKSIKISDQEVKETLRKDHSLFMLNDAFRSRRKSLELIILNLEEKEDKSNSFELLLEETDLSKSTIKRNLKFLKEKEIISIFNNIITLIKNRDEISELIGTKGKGLITAVTNRVQSYIYSQYQIHNGISLTEVSNTVNTYLNHINEKIESFRLRDNRTHLSGSGACFMSFIDSFSYKRSTEFISFILSTYYLLVNSLKLALNYN